MRLALGFLGFTGAFISLLSLDMLKEALNDGLELESVPLLSRFVLVMAPIGHVIWMVPVLVGVGAYDQFLNLDGESSKTPSASQWGGNLVMIGVSIAFTLLGIKREKIGRNSPS